ncbi:fasciclin domain-containing protein [Leptolyngbya sp. FACHB-36]|uniref:fasciclin domain-containing protein n=1 Tax=Leptolyngbya sp. FACHB-36 TaxID=2692808 RepID=UPI001F559C44|nr:fasciclin domain-containing protein [Leptolyngbya sp. FACHB-36]
MSRQLTLRKTAGLSAIVAGLVASSAMFAQASTPTQAEVPAQAQAPTSKPVTPTTPDVAPTAPAGTSPSAPVVIPAPTEAPTAAPVAPAEATPTETAPASTSQSSTIVDVAAANSSFKTLVAAVKAAGLEETLAGTGPFTVFAPTDAAFAALPKGTLAALLKPENKAKLRKVLTYHVVPGAVASNTIKPGKVKTVEGNSVTLRTSGGQVLVNNAKVTAADISASNGVIHVIDKVILPPGV